MLRIRRVKYESSFFFQAEDGIRDLVRSRGLGDVYKRQCEYFLNEKKTYHMPEVIQWVKNHKYNKPEKVLLLSLIHI